MIFDDIQWDDHNLGHATRRLSLPEIEQGIWNAEGYYSQKRTPGRVVFRTETDGGKRIVIVAELIYITNEVRPITAWED